MARAELETSGADVRPGSARAWVLATRPQTLLVGVVPVLVGTASAFRAGKVHWPAALLCLLGAIGLQIGTNLANDVFDYEKGADTEARLGPLRVTQAGLLSPRAVRAGMVASFVFATLAGAGLVALAGWPILVIGIASILSGIAYTGGPFPLGYNGLGDVFVFAFFGVVAVAGTHWVQVGSLDALPFVLSIPVGAISTAVLVVNNVRDHETDVGAGKRTLVVRFGRLFGVIEYAALLFAAYVVPAYLYLSGRVGLPVLLPYVTVPLAFVLAWGVASESGKALNGRLAGTAKLMLVFGILFTIGLVKG